MVTDSLKNREKYASLHEHFGRALEILASLTPDTPRGKIVIDEGNAWVSFYDVKEAVEVAEPTFEAHRDFIDIHCIIKGEELFGYANLDTLTPTTEYFEKDDYLLAKGHINTLKLTDGQFIITFPEDAHIPNMKKLSEGVTVRAIAKIRV